MSEVEMITMNVNVAAADNVGAVGGFGEGMPLAPSSPLQSMGELATSMTKPGQVVDDQQLMAQIGDLKGAENGEAQVKDFMTNAGAVNDYMAAGEKAELGTPLSDMMKGGDMSQLMDVENMSKPMAEMPESMPGVKEALDFYAAGKPALQPDAVAPQAQMPKPAQQAVQAPAAHAEKAVKSPVAQENVMAGRSVKSAQNTPSQPEKPSMSVPGREGQPVVQPPIGKESAAQPTHVPNPKPFPKNEEAVEVRPNLAARAEAEPAVLATDMPLATMQAPGNMDMHKVLNQYLQQNSGFTENHVANLMNDVAADYNSVKADMDALYANLDNDMANMANGNYQPGNVASNDPSKVMGQFMNNPIDLVGSTAMSNNMANLEELVNLQLSQQFTTGFTGGFNV